MLCDVETCEPIHNFYGHTSDVLWLGYRGALRFLLAYFIYFSLAVCPNEVGRVFASAVLHTLISSKNVYYLF